MYASQICKSDFIQPPLLVANIGEEAQEKAIKSFFEDANTISDREKITKASEMFDNLKKKSKAILEIEDVLRGKEVC